MLPMSDLFVQRSHRILLTVIMSMSISHVLIQINMTLSYKSCCQRNVVCDAGEVHSSKIEC